MSHRTGRIGTLDLPYPLKEVITHVSKGLPRLHRMAVL